MQKTFACKGQYCMLVMFSYLPSFLHSLVTMPSAAFNTMVRAVGSSVPSQVVWRLQQLWL